MLTSLMVLKWTRLVSWKNVDNFPLGKRGISLFFFEGLCQRLIKKETVERFFSEEDRYEKGLLVSFHFVGNFKMVEKRKLGRCFQELQLQQ